MRIRGGGGWETGGETPSTTLSSRVLPFGKMGLRVSIDTARSPDCCVRACGGMPSRVF